MQDALVVRVDRYATECKLRPIVGKRLRTRLGGAQEG
jgi:hypothetical protein